MAASISDDLEAWREWSLGNLARHAFSDPKMVRQRLSAACRLPGANVCSAWATTKAQKALNEAWSCDVCGKQLNSKRFLGVHRFRKHGIKSEVRRHVVVTHCPMCLVQFHDRERLIRHLEHAAPHCRQLVLSRFPALPDADVAEAEKVGADRARQLAKQGKMRVHAALPCVRMPGPVEAHRARKPYCRLKK